MKLTGDGTNIARHVHIVNFTFTLLNEGSLALSPSVLSRIAISCPTSPKMSSWSHVSRDVLGCPKPPGTDGTQ